MCKIARRSGYWPFHIWRESLIWANLENVRYSAAARWQWDGALSWWKAIFFFSKWGHLFCNSRSWAAASVLAVFWPFACGYIFDGHHQRTLQIASRWSLTSLPDIPSKIRNLTDIYCSHRTSNFQRLHFNYKKSQIGSRKFGDCNTYIRRTFWVHYILYHIIECNYALWNQKQYDLSM